MSHIGHRRVKHLRKPKLKSDKSATNVFTHVFFDVITINACNKPTSLDVNLFEYFRPEFIETNYLIMFSKTLHKTDTQLTKHH